MSSFTTPSIASDTRRRILDAAAKLFREKGFAGTSQRDIASSCGMQPASLYYHFSSKDDVLTEVLDVGILRVLENVESALAQLDAAATPKTCLTVAMTAHLEMLILQGDYTSAHFRIWKLAPREVQKKTLVNRDRYEGIWSGLFRDMREAGTVREDIDLRVVRFFIFGALNLTLDWYQDGNHTLPELAEMYTDFLLNGIESRAV